MKAFSTQNFRIKIAAIGAPILIFLYGSLRFIDSFDSHGFLWNLGHVLFFISFILLGYLPVELKRLVSGKTKLTIVVAYLCEASGLFGASCFLWGILGDLFQNFAPVPSLLKVIGPLLFQIGMLGLLVMLTAIKPRRLPVWTPILVLIGFMLFAINLDLLSLGALIILIGLSPLVRNSLTT